MLSQIILSLVFLGGLAIGVLATVLARAPWLAARTSQGRQHFILAGAGAAAFAAAVAVIYVAISVHHSADSAAPRDAPAATTNPAKSMQTEVAALEARLARDGGTPADWTLLAQAYDFVGRPEDARRARAHADGSGAAPVNQLSAGALAAAASATESGSSGTVTAASPPPKVPDSLPALEARVRANPRDAQGWLAVAELRRTQRDYAGARSAYARVIELNAMSAQSWADYADVLGSLSAGSLGGEAAQAIDKALALDRANPKALWLRASLAHEQHRFTEALAWWKRLRDVLPPDSPDARIIDGNIAEAASFAGVAPAATTGSGAAPPSTASATEISGTVALDARFASRMPPAAILFIYAKAADSPGPPLAVLRTAAGTWPVSFRLDDSMAMIPSRRLSQFDRIVVEARVSQSGQATPAAGDLYVTSPVVNPAGGKKLALIINREIG